MSETENLKSHGIDIRCGDCLKELPTVPDRSVDAIITDLPYGTTSCKWDSVIPLEPLWEQFERIIKPDGNIVLFAAQMFAHKLALSNERLYRYDLVWKKSKCGSPFTAKFMPMKRHEMILLFGKGGAKYNPQMTEGTPYSRVRTPYRDDNNNMKYGVKKLSSVNNEGTRQPISILDFPQKWRQQDQVHPTQKPVELLRYLVRMYSNEGDTVLDATMGSGTTGIACVNEKRRFIGFEMDENYFKLAENRILSSISEHTQDVFAI